MARQLFCPGKIQSWECDELPPNQSTGKDPKPGVVIRESLDGALKFIGPRRSRGVSRKK